MEFAEFKVSAFDINTMVFNQPSWHKAEETKSNYWFFGDCFEVFLGGVLNNIRRAHYPDIDFETHRYAFLSALFASGGLYCQEDVDLFISRYVQNLQDEMHLQAMDEYLEIYKTEDLAEILD